MSDRYVANEGPLLKVTDPDSEIIECLTEVVTKYPPKSTWAEPDESGEQEANGLYIGPTGIAYLFLHLSKSHPHIVISSKSSKDWVKAYLSGTRAEPDVKDSLCGILCEELCFQAVSAAYSHDISHVQKFLSYIPDILTSNDTNEWVYGRSGALYLLRLIRMWMPDSAAMVNPAIKSLIDCILENGPPFIWYGKPYLGTGHGEMGILFQIVLSDPSRAEQLTPWLSKLLDLQLDNGTWNSVEKEPKQLVQFCHGAPGFAMSLQHIRPYFPSLHERIDSAIARAREITWKEGILKKEPNLCHGVTGNALAFENGEKREHFLAYGTAEKVREGEAKAIWVRGNYGFEWALGFAAPGRAWGFMVMNEKQGRFICYNDI